MRWTLKKGVALAHCGLSENSLTLENPMTTTLRGRTIRRFESDYSVNYPSRLSRQLRYWIGLATSQNTYTKKKSRLQCNLRHCWGRELMTWGEGYGKVTWTGFKPRIGNHMFPIANQDIKNIVKTKGGQIHLCIDRWQPKKKGGTNPTLGRNSPGFVSWDFVESHLTDCPLPHFRGEEKYQST